MDFMTVQPINMTDIVLTAIVFCFFLTVVIKTIKKVENENN